MRDRDDLPPGLPDERRIELLTAALHVFARYGYKKTSMDEVARAAGLSRQGLYLHFPSKDALFRDLVAFVLDRSLGAGRAALAAPGRPIEERLAAAFEAAYGQHVGSLSATPHLAELLEASRQVVGGLVGEQERAFREAVAQALAHDRIAGRWAQAGLSAQDLAEMLDSVACGLKHLVASQEEFVARFRKAVQIVCRPGA